MQAEFRGLTGRIQFKEGRRSSLKLDLLKLRSEQLDKVRSVCGPNSNQDYQNSFPIYNTKFIVWMPDVDCDSYSRLKISAYLFSFWHGLDCEREKREIEKEKSKHSNQ